MAAIYTVFQINNYIKNMFDTDFVLQNVSVTGEISNCKYHSSGHIYFTLKDQGGILSAVMFAGNRAKGLEFTLKDGMKVVVTGNISVYEAAGKYQIYVRQIKEAGNGELYAKYLELKNKLEEMGMFDPMYKKPVPKYIKRLGVVTARTGAAVHDIINVSRRRNPGIEILLYPAKVQGEGAAESICNGIETLEKYSPDVIIVGRGGGSIEDLWAFNEEIVASAVFNCSIPIISAVGHEIDYTIIDFVSDLRAPTPSAAAEMAVCDISETKNRLTEYVSSMGYIVNGRISDIRNKIGVYGQKLRYLSPQNSLNNMRMMLDDKTDRLNYNIRAVLERYKSRFRVLCAGINGASPVARLESGFAYMVNEEGKNISSVNSVNSGDKIKIYLMDGQIDAEVTEITESEKKYGN